MSDLFCAATLLITRHGDAAYDEMNVLADEGGWLTELGRQQAVDLAEALRDRKVAAVWCSDMARAVQTAEIVAGRLGVPVRVRRGLREASVGGFAGEPVRLGPFDALFQRWMDGDLTAAPPDAEDGATVLARVRAELEAAADEFRGETVLIVSHGAAIGLTVPMLSLNVPDDYARGRPQANCAPCEVLADADGWMLKSWSGTPVEPATG